MLANFIFAATHRRCEVILVDSWAVGNHASFSKKMFELRFVMLKKTHLCVIIERYLWKGQILNIWPHQ